MFARQDKPQRGANELVLMRSGHVSVATASPTGRGPEGRLATTAPARPDSASLIFDQALILALALAATSFPILLHLVSPPLAAVVCLGTAGWIAFSFERAVPTLLIVAYTFQTTFVAMASVYARDSTDLEAMKIYSFLTSIGIWVVIAVRFVLTRHAASPFARRLMIVTTGILGLVGLYFLAGLPIDSRGATIYMRNVGLPILLFQVCFVVTSRHEFALGATVSSILVLLVACGYLEFFSLNSWLDLTHGWTYWAIAAKTQLIGPGAVRHAQESGFVVTGVADLLRSSFLNTNLLAGLDLTVVRLQGPNFHPISFGYVLSVLSAVAAVQGGMVLPLLALPLLLFASAKGALVLAIVSVGFCMAARTYRGPLLVPALALALLLYAAFALVSGMRSGDYHVLGFLGGLKGFFENPLGHTLGRGGNLSTTFADIDWSAYQHAGSADVAVESGIGVMLYQLGVATFPIVLMYLWLSGTAWRLYRVLRAPALALSCAFLAVILVNGLFQEEALFAPLALGLIMAIVGLTFGAVDRRFVVASKGIIAPRSVAPFRRTA